jgi:DNA-binding CsgD family transcriptional regulator
MSTESATAITPADMQSKYPISPSHSVKPNCNQKVENEDSMSSVIQVQEVNSAGSPARMKEQKLLQRLVAASATNEGIQPKRTEICQRLKSLTPREFDVLCYILGGQLNREIAAELDITVRTIKHHRGRVMEKLGVQSTAQLFPMVLRYIAWPAWPKFRLRRKKPKKRRPVSR